MAAAALGWHSHLSTDLGDTLMGQLLGVAAQTGEEAEHPDCLMLLQPNREGEIEIPASFHNDEVVEELATLSDEGKPNRLSQSYHSWPIIEEVAQATRHPYSPGKRIVLDHDTKEPTPPALPSGPPAQQIFRNRRSAIAMDGESWLAHDDFCRTLRRLHGDPYSFTGRILPWRPRVALVFFIHRIRGLEPGLYLLSRHHSHSSDLLGHTQPHHLWTRPDSIPEALPFYLLERGDFRDAARTSSCFQDIASDGAYCVSMISRFGQILAETGPWTYREIHWESGFLGQLLYLEAECSGLRATGIGCFFDSLVPELLGLSGDQWKVIYHFTVGGAVSDPRLQNLPAYHHLCDD
jgi:hypothetical protein